MSEEKNQGINSLNNTNLVKLMLDLFHRTTIHHAMWFGELVHQYGRDKAYEILNIVYKQSYDIQIKRLAKTFNAELNEDNLPTFLINMPQQQQLNLLEGLSINWLANDGVWFQAVEKSKGMLEAKRCNDSCWANFSPFEAKSIKAYLNLPENGGLSALKQALNFRLYAFINKQSIEIENENSFIFYMNECRVQVARNRKGMEDYPCKSAGLIEYSSFAEAIDSRIKTECISCPPDKHPNNYYCAWRFIIII